MGVSAIDRTEAAYNRKPMEACPRRQEPESRQSLFLGGGRATGMRPLVLRFPTWVLLIDSADRIRDTERLIR